ncbi:probable cardiolipin synthase (CMP-forming) [Euwallacea fornicatus]|uniref:probable cardiolipin synthase (CMP-forming) n=1 Tax=Euwallacea fornicatus TaxID=995702 RepID=UPI00338FE76C
MNVFRRTPQFYSQLFRSSFVKFKHNAFRKCPIHQPLQRFSCCSCRLYCTNSDGSSAKFTPKREEIKAYLEQNKEKLRDTEQRFKERGYVILQDLKDTRSKVKEKVEEIVIKENIYTIPNFLCITRMIVSPYLGVLIVQGNFNFALGVLGFAAITDLLDGWIARTWESQSSKMGSFLDPMADKILIATLFLTLTYADLIPVVLTGLIITRDVLLVVAGFIIRYQSLPPPRTLVRYFNATNATAQLAPTFISKVNTAVQLLLVGTTLAAPVFDYINHPVLQGLWYITAGTTVAAALSYILSKNTYKILTKSGTK